MSVNEVQVVLCIDASGSMNQNGYLSPAKLDSTIFTNIMLPDDAVGVVSFKNSASYVADNGASPPQVAILDKNNTVRASVLTAISKIKASGSTNMSEGLAFSNNLINHQDTTRNASILLLSDGYSNMGTIPPTLPSNCPPVYSIALGPKSDVSTLKKLASDSGGEYHLSPRPLDLASIYFDIASQTGTVSQTVSNEILPFNTSTQLLAMQAVPSLSAVQTLRTGGMVPEAAKQISLAVSWLEESIIYVSGTPTKSNQFSLKLYVNGSLILLDKMEVRDQYLLIPVTSAVAGVFVAEISYLGSGSFQPTVAILDYTKKATSGTNLVVNVNRHSKVGEAVNLSAYLEGIDGNALSDVIFKGTVTAPQANTSTADEAGFATEKEVQMFLQSDGVDNDGMSAKTVEGVKSHLLAQGTAAVARYPFTAIQSQHSQDEHRSTYTFMSHVPGMYVIRLHAECRQGPAETHFSIAKVMTIQVI
jgi:hypothetical protein